MCVAASLTLLHVEFDELTRFFALLPLVFALSRPLSPTRAHLTILRSTPVVIQVDQEMLFEIILAANYLDIKPLLCVATLPFLAMDSLD